MKKSSFFGLIAFLLGCCSLGLALIALCTTQWQYNINTGVEKGLFEECQTRRANCAIFINGGGDWEKAAASFMVSGGVFVLAGVLVSIFIGCGRVCCKKSGCKLNILGGVFYLVGAIFVCVCCSVYTATINNNANSDTDFGFSIWLAWASFALGFIASLVTFIAKESSKQYKV